MNSTVGPIFNKKVAEKWDLWVMWTVHGTHWCAKKSNITATIHEQCINSSRNSEICLLKHVKKKKKKKRVKH